MGSVRSYSRRTVRMTAILLVNSAGELMLTVGTEREIELIAQME